MIHNNYDRLHVNERTFVDDVFHHVYHWRGLHYPEIKLHGDDTIERAVEALATAIVESNPGPRADDQYELEGGQGCFSGPPLSYLRENPTP